MGTPTATTTTRFFHKAVPMALLAMVLLASTGCTRMGGLRARMAANEIAHTVELKGLPVTIGRFIAVDIENPKGNVKVVALSRNEEAYVRFRVQKEHLLRWRSMRMKLGFDPNGEYFTAEHITDGELSTIVVRPTDLTIEGYRLPVDVTVYVPQCHGLRVLNAGGKVDVVGVTGVIDIVSGNAQTKGGKVEIRTESELHETISVWTNNGDITLVTGPDAGGTIELIAPHGRTSFWSKHGHTEHSRPEVGRWTGIWNNGSNSIKLESRNGNTKLMVVANPIHHSLVLN
ncbi:MAG: hypothetical protein JKY96_03440 [Phycisphaerales bacterium]|nr:hypothetical protein [Phycisphaerales bacterium]